MLQCCQSNCIKNSVMNNKSFSVSVFLSLSPSLHHSHSVSISISAVLSFSISLIISPPQSLSIPLYPSIFKTRGFIDIEDGKTISILYTYLKSSSPHIIVRTICTPTLVWTFPLCRGLTLCNTSPPCLFDTTFGALLLKKSSEHVAEGKPFLWGNEKTKTDTLNK